MVKNKMNGEERRNKIIDYIEHSPVPVSGTALANHFSVSRQAVVQDIALLRASGNDILSTNRGYVIAPKPKVFTRTFKVSHSDDQTADELSLIVDLGGKFSMYLLTTMYTAVLKQSSILPQDVMSPDSLKMWKAAIHHFLKM